MDTKFDREQALSAAETTEETSDRKTMDTILEPEANSSAEQKDKNIFDIESATIVEPATTPSTRPEKESGYAWLVLLSAFFCGVFGWGTLFGQGIWQRYFFSTQFFGSGTTQQELAWIGSIGYFACMILGIFVGRVSDIWGHQRVLIAGTLLFALSFLLSSFATQVWHLYLTQGIIYGLSLACIYIPSSGILVQYWTTRRALAISLTGMGSGVGGFIWPNAFQAMLDAVGARWTYRIMALMGLLVLSVCTLILKPHSQKRSGPRPKFVDTSFFKSRHYWLLSAVGFFVTFGYYTPSYYLSQYASDMGLATSIGSLLVGVMNGSALLFRLIQTPLTKLLGASTVFALSITLAGLAQVLIWPFVKSLGGILAFTIVFGLLGAGGYLGCYPIVVAYAFPENYASALGLVFFWCAPGGLVGPVIAGSLFDANSVYVDGTRTTNYLPIQIFGGATMIVAGLVAFVEMLVLMREKGGGWRPV